jgi:adenylate cyclase
MTESLLSYIPMDRRHALRQGRTLPAHTHGAALFADVSGFTPLTEALVRELGPLRGAEELTVYLNQVYDALIEQLHHWRGSAVAFAGDAVTCWFDGDDGRHAVACALAMQQAMQHFHAVQTPFGSTIALSLKAAVATGPVRRWLVGDPAIRVIDALAGATLERLAAAEHEADRGEVVVAPCAWTRLGDAVKIAAVRTAADGRTFAVVETLHNVPAAQPWPAVSAEGMDEAILRSWLLAPVYARLRQGLGNFLAELRPTVALFLRFGGIDYDDDPAAGEKLDGYVRWVQSVVERYQGTLIDLNIGDKGSYIYINFGAPITHEDNAARAASTALTLQQPPPQFAFITPVQIGISQGRMRAGAYGGNAHRTYGVLGDEVNLAARLMMACRPGQILVSEAAHRRIQDNFDWEKQPPRQVRGKSNPVVTYALLGVREREALHMPSPANLPPMIGRRQEIGQIVDALRAVRAGQGRVIGVEGGPGIGKSRFVAEVVHLAYQDDFTVFGGECDVYGINTSYLAWQPIWRGLFHLDASWPPEKQSAWLRRQVTAVNPALVDRLPLLNTLLGAAIPDNNLTRNLDPKLRKESLEGLLAECLRHFTRQKPTLLVLEECHWLDPLSHDLFEVLARAVEALPVLILFAYRPVDLERLKVQRISTLPYYSEIQLQELRGDELEELARIRLAQIPGARPETPLPGTLLERIVQQAEGNPFYLEELVNFIRYNNIDPYDAYAFHQIQLPESLQSLVLSRLDQLSERHKTTLKVASVVGRSFRLSWLPGIYAELGDADSLHEDLIHLTEQELTVPDPDEADAAYFFKHAITHSVIYESLLHMLRTSLHEQVGQFIERTQAERLHQFLDLLAFHYDHSENKEKRRHYLRHAGEAAQASYANEVAVDYYRRLLPLLPPTEQVEIIMKLAEVEQLVGRWDEAVTLFGQAIQLAQQHGDRQSVAWCETATGEIFSIRGAYAEAAAWLDRAESSFRAQDDRRGLGHLLHYAGTLAARQGDYVTARLRYEQSLAIRRQLNDEPKIASLLSNLGILARFDGDYITARALYEEGLAIRRRLQDRWAIASSLNNLGLVARYQNNYNEARTFIEESVSLFRQVGARWDLANTLHSLGEIALDLKDYTAARRCLLESLQLNQTLGDRRTMAFLFEGFAGIAAAQQQPERALKLAGAAAALRETIGAPLSPAESTRLERRLEPARQILSPAAADTSWQEGRALTLNAATDYAQRADGA